MVGPALAHVHDRKCQMSAVGGTLPLRKVPAFRCLVAAIAGNHRAVEGTSVGGGDLRHMSGDVRRNMRARINQCRRLAKYVNDPRTTKHSREWRKWARWT